MKHKKCGGRFVKIERNDSKTTYQCNKCGTVRTMYKKTATSGNQKKESKK